MKSLLQKQPRLSFLIPIFLLYGVIGSLILGFFFLNNWNQSVYKISFDLGDLLQNMVQNDVYRSIHQSYYHTEKTDLTFAAHRLPFIPYFLYSIIKLTGFETVGKIALIKNSIFMLIMAVSFYFAMENKSIAPKYKWFALFFILTFPQLFVHGLEIDLEESYAISLVALFWGLICYSGKPSKWFNIIFVFSTTMLFFAKNTFLYICPLLPILYYILYGNKKIVAISYLLLIFAYVGLATKNYYHAGKFSLNYTFEGLNLYKGNCARTMDYYPKYSIDMMDYENPMILPASEVQDEWQFDAYYKKQASSYIKSHKMETFKRLFTKFFTIFIDIRPNGIFPNEERFDSPFKYLGAFYMLIFRILEWLCIFIAGYCIFKKRENKRLFTFSVSYLLFIAFFCGPYVLAFGYERHLAPVFIPIVYSTIYFLNELMAKKEQIKNV